MGEDIEIEGGDVQLEDIPASAQMRFDRHTLQTHHKVATIFSVITEFTYFGGTMGSNGCGMVNVTAFGDTIRLPMGRSWTNPDHSDDLKSGRIYAWGHDNEHEALKCNLAIALCDFALHRADWAGLCYERVRKNVVENLDERFQLRLHDLMDVLGQVPAPI